VLKLLNNIKSQGHMSRWYSSQTTPWICQPHSSSSDKDIPDICQHRHYAIWVAISFNCTGFQERWPTSSIQLSPCLSVPVVLLKTLLLLMKYGHRGGLVAVYCWGSPWSIVGFVHALRSTIVRWWIITTDTTSWVTNNTASDPNVPVRPSYQSPLTASHVP
jgi:hypothetical protein